MTEHKCKVPPQVFAYTCPICGQHWRVVPVEVPDGQSEQGMEVRLELQKGSYVSPEATYAYQHGTIEHECKLPPPDSFLNSTAVPQYICFVCGQIWRVMWGKNDEAIVEPLWVKWSCP